MIDTLHIRIHNLQKCYKQLYEQLYIIRKDTVSEIYYDKESGEVFSAGDHVHSLFYHDNNTVIPLVQRNNLSVPSSHYTVSYCINLSSDWVDLNFSIPKYIYGTNILQFIDYYCQSCQTTYLLLIRFLDTFFRDNFIELPNKKDVEIRRIDFCYNQFFNSRLDALQYLDYQKELLVKYARSSQNNYRSYETSLMYVTARYSFKIYHKGTEFRKHDYKELVKNNAKAYDLQYLLDQSDNILRYEITFRASYINYLFNSYFFSSAERSETAIIRDHPVSKVMRAFAALGFADYFTYWQSRQKIFCLGSHFDNYNSSRTKFFDSYKDDFNVTFCSVVFSILYDEFWKKVKQYQVNVKLSVGQVMENIAAYNKKIALKNDIRRTYSGGKTKQEEGGLSNSRVVILSILSQYVNLQELYKVGLIPKSTYYRIKSDLKKVGVTEYSPNMEIPAPRLDFVDYKCYFGKYIT